MSEANVELVREIYARWNRRESTAHLIDAELEYVNPDYALEAGTSRGRATLARIRDVYPDFRIEPERFLDAGEDVVVIGVAHGTSTSGVQIEWRQGYVWTIRDGVAVRFRWFNHPAEALAAVGLAP
jgi:uncharacterized protein